MHRENPVRTGIGRTQPAVDGRRTCTICGISVVEVVPIRTETVRRRTEAVRKRCKYGVRLQQAESVLCPCVRAIFHVMGIVCVYLTEISLKLTLNRTH